MLLQFNAKDYTFTESWFALTFHFISFLFLFFCPAPSPVSGIRKEKTTRNSVSLAWQEPERPNGIILDYEIKYYEKVGVKTLIEKKKS